jgi:hypothetical protein
MADYFKRIDTNALDRQLESGEFPFRQNLFWDSPLEKIDLIKNKRYVVERVVTRGFLEDFYKLLKIYDRHEIIESLIKSKELDPKTVDFCSRYFQIPKSKMHVSSFYY